MALSKGQRRLNTIFASIPPVREQLLVAMEDVDPGADGFVHAATSKDARERNKVAAIERDCEILVNWLHELAARSLAEGQRQGVIDKASGHPWERLAALGAISNRSATRLQKTKELRDELAHAYPTARWTALYEGVETLLSELDRYLDRCRAWLAREGILEEAESR